MLYYGAAYYPEQETPATIAQDVKLMKEIGFNVVRIGEFAWAKMEPREGEYCLAWLDQVVDQLGTAGINTLLCTPSACPPRWMVDRHPEILYCDHRGVVRPIGCRRHYCYNAPIYRDYCQKMARTLGKRYGNNPHVIGLHIDNELAQEATGRCHCQICQRKFRLWLEQKYQTINNFNERIGATFWSQDYDGFNQINPPLRTIEESADPQLIESFMDNPTLRLDWERFCSESIVQFLNVQRDELRQHSKLPITTNGTGIGTNGVDYYKCFAGLEVMCGDIYPSLRTDSMHSTTTDYAFHRGVKAGQNFWVAETSAGGSAHGVWGREGRLQPFPGTLHQNALQAVACGAELVTYFQWRTFRYGAEQLESSIIDIDSVPRRRFKEFQAAATEIKKLAPLLESSHIVNDVAVCYDFETYWAIRIKPFKRGYDYRDHLHGVASPLAERGIHCDVVPCTAAINNYKMVVVPTPLVMDEPFKQILREYVRGGGTLVTNFLAAIKNADNNAPRAEVPAGLTDLFGMRVGEGEIVYDDPAHNSVSQISLHLDGQRLQSPNRWWTEVLEPNQAEVFAWYDDTFRKGQPVMSRNHFGAGKAYYLGTWLEREAMGQLLASIARDSGVKPVPIIAGKGVEVIRRVRGDGSPAYFVFNYSQHESDAFLETPLCQLSTGQSLQGRVILEAKGCLVVGELSR